MFGIFYLMFDGIMSTINGIDRDYQNSKNRIEAKNLGDLTYFGSRGGEYLVENGRQVMRTIRSYDNHEIIKDMRTGKVYYDLTIIKKKRDIEECKKRGETIYHDIYDRIPKWGSHYKDIETEHYVKEITINDLTYYMDLNTGYLLRLTDYIRKGIQHHDRVWWYNYNNNFISPNEIIEIFNKRQDKLRHNKKYKNNTLWTEKVFWLDVHHGYNHNYYMNKEGKFVRGILTKSQYSFYENNEFLQHSWLGENYFTIEETPIIVNIDGEEIEL